MKLAAWAMAAVMNSPRRYLEFLRKISNFPAGRIRRRAEKNYRSNQILEDRELKERKQNGYYENQNLPVFGKMRMGAAGMDRCGCGCIAIFNAWQALRNGKNMAGGAPKHESRERGPGNGGEALSLSSVVRDLEREKAAVLGGRLGIDPYTFYRYWKACPGLRVEVLIKEEDIRKLGPAGGDAYVISVWNERGNLFAGMHTVAISRDGMGLFPHNGLKRGPYRNFKELLDKNPSCQPVLLVILSRLPSGNEAIERARPTAGRRAFD